MTARRDAYDDAYIHGTIPEEQERLSLLNGLLNAACLRELGLAGGERIVLSDDDHAVLRLWPEPPGLMALWKAYYRTYDRIGNDPFVGRRLVALLHEAGARPRRNTGVFFGSCAGHPSFPAFVENLSGVLRGAREAILGHALFDASYFEEALAAFEAWCRRPDAALWYMLCWAEGIAPETTG